MLAYPLRGRYQGAKRTLSTISEESGAAKNGFGVATRVNLRKMASAPRRTLTCFVTLARARAFPRIGPPGRCSGCRDALSYGVSFATTRSHQLARGSPACFLSPAFRADSLYPLGRVGAEESGAAKNKAIADQSPLLKLSLRRVRFQRTSTRQQLDCAKTL